MNGQTKNMEEEWNMVVTNNLSRFIFGQEKYYMQSGYESYLTFRKNEEYIFMI